MVKLVTGAKKRPTVLVHSNEVRTSSFLTVINTMCSIRSIVERFCSMKVVKQCILKEGALGVTVAIVNSPTSCYSTEISHSFN